MPPPGGENDFFKMGREQWKLQVAFILFDALTKKKSFIFPNSEKKNLKM